MTNHNDVKSYWCQIILMSNAIDVRRWFFQSAIPNKNRQYTKTRVSLFYITILYAITILYTIKIDNTLITLSEEAGQAIRSTSNHSSKPVDPVKWHNTHDKRTHLPKKFSKVISIVVSYSHFRGRLTFENLSAIPCRKKRLKGSYPWILHYPLALMAVAM